MIKISAPYIVNLVTNIFNCSILSGIFPDYYDRVSQTDAVSEYVFNEFVNLEIAIGHNSNYESVLSFQKIHARIHLYVDSILDLSYFNNKTDKTNITNSNIVKYLYENSIKNCTEKLR